MTTYTDFGDVYNAVSKEVPFDEKWPNATGYMDGAVHVTFTEPVKFTDPYGRRGVILPIKPIGGNLVMFERYSVGDAIVSNEPWALRGSKFLQGEIGRNVGLIVDAVDVINQAIGSEMEDLVTKALKRDGGVLLDVVVESVRVGRGGTASISLPTEVIPLLKEAGLLVDITRRDKPVEFKVGEDGGVLVNDPTYGWEAYNTVMGDEVRYVDSEKSAEIILRALAS